MSNEKLNEALYTLVKRTRSSYPDMFVRVGRKILLSSEIHQETLLDNVCKIVETMGPKRSLVIRDAYPRWFEQSAPRLSFIEGVDKSEFIAEIFQKKSKKVSDITSEVKAPPSKKVSDITSAKKAPPSKKVSDEGIAKKGETIPLKNLSNAYDYLVSMGIGVQDRKEFDGARIISDIGEISMAFGDYFVRLPNPNKEEAPNSILMSPAHFRRYVANDNSKIGKLVIGE